MPATSLMITAHQMRREDELGHVRLLHPEMPEIRKLQGAWWIASPDPVGWLRITDQHIASRLDHIRRRLDIAEDNLACEKAMKNVDSHWGFPE